MPTPIGDGYDAVGSCGEAQVICTTQAPAADVTGLRTRRVYVGGAGNLAVTMLWTSASIIISSVAAGSDLPLRVKSIHSTGTSATGITVFW
jgi:hypothetical protein